MDKEREIKNIAEIIDNRVGTNLRQIHGTKSGYGKCADITTTVATTLVAKAIVEAGYGDTKQAVREFAEKVKERLEHYRIENEEKTENGEWQLDSVEFCGEVIHEGGLIDKLLAEVTGE